MTNVVHWVGTLLYLFGAIFLAYGYSKRGKQISEIRSLKADVAELRFEVSELTAIRDGLAARVMALEAKSTTQGKRIDVTAVTAALAPMPRGQVAVASPWDEMDRMVAEKRREAFEREREERDKLRDELLHGKPL